MSTLLRYVLTDTAQFLDIIMSKSYTFKKKIVWVCFTQFLFSFSFARDFSKLYQFTLLWKGGFLCQQGAVFHLLELLDTKGNFSIKINNKIISFTWTPYIKWLIVRRFMSYQLYLNCTMVEVLVMHNACYMYIHMVQWNSKSQMFIIKTFHQVLAADLYLSVVMKSWDGDRKAIVKTEY